MNSITRHNYPVNTRTMDATHRLVQHYLRRQALVAVAMLQVHPSALQLCGTHLFKFEIQPFIEVWQRRIQRQRHWQAGVWQGEWRYRVYGSGCHLTNIHTGEPLAWDAPDLTSFNENDFWTHLQWRMEATTDPTLIDPYINWLKHNFFEMRQQAILLEAEGGRLALLPENAKRPG
ncbi:MAG: hypothetical protein K8L99_01710 [Anaerolineae bacterium]|nr:hypothetical protein [Anaerolineae bacterium]